MQIEDSWVIRSLMENSEDSIYIKDRQCRICKINQKMAENLGLSSPAEIYGKTDIELFGKEFGEKTMQDDLEVMETGVSLNGIIDKNPGKNGDYNWTSTNKMPLRNDEGEIIGLVGITREINDLKSTEYEYMWKATHDPLTALPNRTYLVDRINKEIAFTILGGGGFSILFIDLNGFKSINDRFGHDLGDEYLVRVGQVLSMNLRPTDVVARYGGDEFIVLLKDVRTADRAELVANKVSTVIYQNVDPEQHTITASIGIAYYPKDGATADTLIKAADRSMYAAKHNNIPFVRTTLM